MKRLLCGSVVFAASLALASCASDPTGDFRGDPARITADPSSIFLPAADDKDVIVRLEDNQGDPLPGDWEITAPGSGFTVERNPDFQGTTVGAPLESEAQFVVTAGASPISSSFTIAAGGISLEIPVRVLPTDIAAAVFSNPTPAVNEAVNVTAEGFTFLPTAGISFGGTPALVLGVSEDGTTLSFLPPPGTTGVGEIQNVAINFLPTTPLTLATTAELTVADVVPLAGTDAPGTAPALVVPEVGATSTLYDGGTYDYAAPLFGTTIPARLYSFTIPADGDYTVSLDWDGGVEDMGVYYFEADGTTETGSAADAGGGGEHPEASTSTFTAGTYLMAVVNFSATNPGFISIQFTAEPPAE